MRVILQDANTRCYYSSPGVWVNERSLAKDFRLVEDAIAFNTEQSIGATHVVLAYDNPACNLSLPVANYAKYTGHLHRKSQSSRKVSCQRAA